ncbi:hypothetical protein EGW08_016758 [Elysia chlorotica]|uniref:C3H1-type domain-containing protein n=1 Tax=Elysia chlorotica TaxID=188477 RepID=A0A3S0ZE25_ELYCH|nr:hypothetical protein EGW08_016758 [Elysia chlorotica]
MALLTSSHEAPGERYIPGMAHTGRPGAGSVSPPSAQPEPPFQNEFPAFHQPPTPAQQNSPQDMKPPLLSFNRPPPSVPAPRPQPPQPAYATKPPLIAQPPSPSPSQPHSVNNHTPRVQTQPNPGQAAPVVSNPFPNLECRLLCPACLQFTGRPWFYLFHSKLPHQCQQSILAYRIVNDCNQTVWVQVRERASHRHFKGNYVICHSVSMANPDLCKFKETCSFAHNLVEQAIWKLEQEGRYDIGEYMMRYKRLDTANTNFPGIAQSSSGMYVRDLLDKFGGYFRFICRECFFTQRPMISGLHSSGTVCAGAGRHLWQQARIIAHVKDTAYTPVDERKFHHEGAFYLMCNFQLFCPNWYKNRCRFAHSQVEKAVWMMERDTKISRDELVQQSQSLFTAKQTMSAPPPAFPNGGQAQRGLFPQTSGPAWQGQGQGHQEQASANSSVNVPPVTVTEYCRTCWGKGQRSEEDKGRDKCVRGHSNFKLNSAFVAVPAVKEIRSLPSVLSAGMKLVLCEYHPKCSRRVCNHPHGQEELEVWAWMLRNGVKTLREVCDRCKQAQKEKTRKIDKGESVISVAATPQAQVKSVNQIIAPGDLHIHEHYCQYCGISCNSDVQWDQHCMSERHINNVNSDREHQWNFRQPPWGDGNNLDLCAKHLHNKSCQYSYVPDMYNMCSHAHSQEELDEWRERFEWRQMKRTVARDRNMSSYTEALLEEYHSQGDSVNVISDSIPDVHITCNEPEVLYRIEKNDIFTWTYEIRSQKSLEKVALLHNKDRLHFKLLSSAGGHYQMASGDIFLEVDAKGRPCYKVAVHFNGGIFGSFSQWIVFDFGSRPVLRKKLSVEIGDQLQHDRVRELREELDFERWTSQNKQIVRAGSELIPDHFTEQMLNKYKEPSASDVVTAHQLTELNQHNYIHKMHGLLELEEITRQAIISRYNLSCEVTFSKTLQESGMFLIGTNGDLFIKVNLTENLNQDTLSGKLVLSSVRTALLARPGSASNKVYEASLVGESNYGYDGRGKEYVYLVINEQTSQALGVSQGQTARLELQFQLDRRFFCRMHYALDSMPGTDVVFPDVVKFKSDTHETNTLSKIRSSVLNEDQMIAVRHIVVQRDGYTPPFIMYGPFGTGKTETLAQATMALLRERKDSCRILICTQSNSAADLYITKHLHAFVSKGSGKNLRILRLNAEERRRNTVPDEVMAFCHSPDRKSFAVPSKQEIANYHVVLTTVENSLVLTSRGMHGCFTHIFVDEAGQTLECEILMPLSLATTKTCVVLTGDHHQIGPTVYSPEARRQNFGVSILVRLFNYYDSIANCSINLLSDKCQKSPLNIFLSVNYRTKTEILRFISSVFYGGPESLKAYGKIPSVMGITPLMFYAVQGRESQNVDSTSYLNHSEAQEVVVRVAELLDNWPAEWGPKDPSQIAVISTYSDQVKHVRKMLRQDKGRPLLSQVDVGPIHSFQGKEVRALFISAVRTSNLLREPHIIRSLEANEDIGDLGFMSDPKLLNTALTRTQSFVAVVGDPSVLCLIGECTQIWRTYLKHCSIMGSIRPMSYTYDAIRNMARQIELGPERQAIEMIAKRGQESFKHMLNIRKAAKPEGETINEASENHGATNGGDGDREDRSLNREVHSFTSIPRSSGDDQIDRKETLDTLQPGYQNRRSNELAANMTTISGDILFQLATECQEGTAAASPIQPEGISVSLERDSLALLTYSPRCSGYVQVHEPFKLVSEDDDFVAFRVRDEDTGLEEVYENWSKDKLWSMLSAEPDKFFKCVLTAKSRDVAVAMVLGADSHAQMVNKQIEIKGSLSRGHAFDGDTVVVELTGSSNDVLQGQVRGILERARDPSLELYVCTADPEKPGILVPVNTAVPRFYSIISTPHVALARKGYVCAYKFDSRNGIKFSSYEKVMSAQPDAKLFVVRYVFWQPGFLLPCGLVVGVIRQDRTLQQGRKIIEVEHNVKHGLSDHTLKEAEDLFPADSMVPTDLLVNRRDLTQMFCFSVCDSHTQDQEIAISVLQTGSLYELGLHVTDVVAYVDKDSVVDQECEQRGASLFPLGQGPIHMLPPKAAAEVCSLRPGLDRLAFSVVTRVDGEGRICGTPDIFRSVIKNRRHFSHAEVEDILLAPEEIEGDYLKSCIIVLYQLAFLWRGERLGNAQFFSGLRPEQKLTQHSHLIMHEVKLRFDSLVASVLLSSFPETTPLLIQPPPPAEKLDKWKRENAVFAIHNIPMTRAFLDNKVCVCKTVCTCVFSYIRQHRLENVKHLAMLRESWLTLCQAASEDYQDFDLAQEVIASPEALPSVWLSARGLADIQQAETYICSDYVQSPGDMAHYGLCVQACTAFSSPLRSFISLVVQRMLAAHIDRAPSPYNSAEMSDLCSAVTLSEKDAAAYHTEDLLLHLSVAIQARPLVVTAVVESVDSKTLRLNLGPSLSSLSSQEIDLRLLTPESVSVSQAETVQLAWQERIYQYPGTDTPARCESSIKLDPDALVCNIPFSAWQKLLIAVREKDDDKLQAFVKDLSQQVERETAQRLASQPQLLSDGSRPVQFSLGLTRGQAVLVQLCAGLRDGRLQPVVQLVQLSPRLDMCVQHRIEPEVCFTYPGSASQPQATYNDERKYVCEWLLPALALESACQAVESGERVTIQGVDIKWTKGEPIAPGDGHGLSGTFALTHEFCERNSFWPNSGSDLASALLGGKLPYCEDANFSLDFVCVRYSGLTAPQSPGLEESVAALLNNLQPITWVGHCLVTEVIRSAQGFQVKVVLVHSSMNMPEKLFGRGNSSHLCTLEWISKTEELRTLDIAARGLLFSSSFVKDIITGKKPLSTLDPIPLDNSIFQSGLHTEQEAVIASCYRQPFLTVIGGPGTGKSTVAARLAHLLAARNRTRDSFHTTGGPGNQLMVCAATEESLDVITGYLQQLNLRNVHMVRVYSQEVEERDFPLFPSSRQVAERTSCVVMEDLALHHRIRHGDSAEVKELLEQELLLAMSGSEVTADVRASMERAQVKELTSAHIILCTALTSARPVLQACTNIRQLIMDDANLIPEVEVFVPLVVHRNVNQLVMFGDPQMPWKKLCSDQALRLGLSRPLLLRFAQEALVLRRQFRTTESVARLPFNHFYPESQVSTRTEAGVPVAAQTIPWPGEAGTSCVFCHVQGEESHLQSAASGDESLVNNLEIQAVVGLVRSLLGYHQVREPSIMVLAATQGQAMALRECLPRSIEVATVLASIGRERDYVILSTVRSVPFAGLERPVSSRWAREHMGSMADSGTVNLAITRARSALFIFGNKELLGCCEPWQSLLNSFRQHQCLQADWALFLDSLNTH